MLTACQSDPTTPDAYEEMPIAGVLPHYTVPAYQYWDEVGQLGHTTFIFNNAEDVTATLGADIAETSPEYLTVDYSRYSLLVQYHVMTQQIEDRRYYFYRRSDIADTYQLTLAYTHGDNLTHSEILVDRVAVTVAKLPANAHVQWAETIYEPK